MEDSKIRKIYLLSHTHTDLGYTDHLAAVQFHHRDILDQALAVCEETIDSPVGAQHRWTCEITSTTLDYLRNTAPENVDRFLRLHKDGRISVGGLRYHWTPLVSRHLAVRTLRDIEALRNEFGIEVRSAMQCDVNGLAWFWNDLLLASGVDFLMTMQNSHRGYWGRHVPSAWHWLNRNGGRLLVCQAEHYGVGGPFLRLARRGRQDRAELRSILTRHRDSTAWPLEFTVLSVTNTANGDNVYPDKGLSNAVAEWNETEEVPMEIVTLDGLSDVLRASAEALPERGGEWMDSWCDGVASTPLETAAARAAERLLPAIERLGGAADPAFGDYLDALSLYDEHTWGAHSSATAPDSLFAIGQRIQKSNHAYRACALGLRIMAKASRERMPEGVGPVEGDASFDAVSRADVGPDDQPYLVANPYDRQIEVDWPVPFDRGAGPQISIPQAYCADEFFAGFGQDGWTDRLQAGAPGGDCRIRAVLPPGAVRVVRPGRVRGGVCGAGRGWLETPLTRIELCQETGGISSWIEKSIDRDLLDGAVPIFSPTVEVIRPGFHQRQIFLAPYWERSDTPMGWNKDDLFAAAAVETHIDAGAVEGDEASTVVTRRFDCGISISTIMKISAASPWIRVAAIQRAGVVEQGFSICWSVSFPEFAKRLLMDTGAGLIDAHEDHVPSSCRRWQSVQNGLAFENENNGSIVISSPDAPLFQPGGPWSREPHRSPGRTVAGCFWSVNTHWDTNFPVRVHDPAPFRTAIGYCPEGGPDGAADLLERMAAIPVIVRAPYAAEGEVSGYWAE